MRIVYFALHIHVYKIGIGIAYFGILIHGKSSNRGCNEVLVNECFLPIHLGFLCIFTPKLKQLG